MPETVLAQLGNRVQHALRAFTPRDQKAVRVAAETFRQNPAFDTEKAITELGVGEALVSTLEGKGSPSMVERTLIAPPLAQVGPIDPESASRSCRRALCAASTTQPSTRNPPTRCWRSAPRRPRRTPRLPRRRGRHPRHDRQRLRHHPQRGDDPSPPARRSPEVTRTVVNQAIGGLAAELGRAIGGRQGSSIGRAIVRGTLGGLLKR